MVSSLVRKHSFAFPPVRMNQCELTNKGMPYSRVRCSFHNPARCLYLVFASSLAVPGWLAWGTKRGRESYVL